jgi:hypothetical protein
MTTIWGDRTCPSCGGCGGGPFGRPGSAWDVEDYVCPRCEGLGYLAVEAAPATEDGPTPRPGIAKTAPHVVSPAQKKQRASRAG